MVGGQKNPKFVKFPQFLLRLSASVTAAAARRYFPDDVVSLPSFMFSVHEREDCGSSVFGEMKDRFHQKEAPAANFQIAEKPVVMAPNSHDSDCGGGRDGRHRSAGRRRGLLQELRLWLRRSDSLLAAMCCSGWGLSVFTLVFVALVWARPVCVCVCAPGRGLLALGAWL